MPKRKGYITRQAKRLSDGEINRRRFVMSALSAGVTMPTALCLATKAEARMPKPGGTLRLALAEGPGGFCAADTCAGRLIAFARGNALTEIASDGRVIGELAEGFGASPDQTTWWFDLRRDVLFQTGAPMTAEAVTATIHRQAALIPHLRGLHTEGPHRVVLELAAAVADLPRRLADPRLVILDGDAGTGPYSIETAGPDHILLRRVPVYWKPGRAHFEAVEIHVLPDVAARQRAIMTGDVDYADGIDPRALALLHQMPDIHVLDLATGRYIALDTGSCEPALRARVLSALPQQEVVERLLLGHGTRGPALAGAPAPMAAPPAMLRLGVIDDGVPRGGEIARLLAARLGEAGLEVEFADNEDAGESDLRLSWSRNDATETPEDRVTLAWANDLSAYRSPLTHAERVASNAENDGARLIERWWFG